MNNSKLSLKVRIIHRYLGYFLAGIMAVYALSGSLMIFRKTNFLKKEVTVKEQLDSNLSIGALSAKLKIGVTVNKKEDGIIYFKEGSYNEQTGLAIRTKMKLPLILEKMEKLHKATTQSPLYFLNLFFGGSLLFFALSSFWMYAPKMPIFKKGLYFALSGAALTVLMLFF